MRTYERTHPWLTFVADLTASRPRLWMNLGAIQSQCDSVGRVMLPPDVAQDLLQIYLAKGVQATTAIEGNTLSEDEVLQRIRGVAPELPRSKAYLGREVDNIIAACNEIQSRVIDGDESDSRLSPSGIREFNRRALEGLDHADHVVPGAYRQVSVGVGTYRGAPAEDCEFLVEELCRWINDKIRPPSESERIAFGVIRAVLAQLYLAWIHPFGDGNGRTARLVELQILLGVGVPNIAAHLLSNHYNQTRAEYYRQLDYASKSGGDINRFLEYAAQGLADGLSETMARIREFQIDVTWRDYVYARFRNLTGPAADRRRQLALDLWWSKAGAALPAIPRLSTELAGLYARKTNKTISRDLNALEEMALVVRDSDQRIHANADILLAFLPARKEHPTGQAPKRQRR